MGDICTLLEVSTTKSRKGKLMSVKIKISYTTDEELKKVLQALSPVMKGYKISKNQEGKYKKVYVEVKE